MMIFKPIFKQIISAFLAGLFLLPFFWMVTASLRQPGLPPPRSVEWLPTPLSWVNYDEITRIIPIGRYLFNSLMVATLGVFGTLLTASWAGLGMAMSGKKARLRLLLFSFALQTIPITALWLTRFLLFARIGITNSQFALIAPAIMGTSPLFVLLFYWAFRRIGMDVFESALMDGAHLFQVWWKIALPLAGPALMAVGMLTFLYYWNDFTGPLLYLRSQASYTLSVGILQLQQMDRTDWPLLMSASVIMTLPAVIIFAILQRSLLWWNVD